MTKARIGCLDIQHDGNLTGIVGQACDHKMACSYKAPTEDEYKRAGVHAATRTFCTQAMEITYSCGGGETRTVTVPGDAWKHPAAELRCEDTGGDLGAWTNKTAPLMTNTPGLFRFLAHTGHSLDDERPMWVAREIVNFLAGDPHAPH